VAVKIRLKRMGKIRTPYYRIVVADARKKRDGRVIEEIGKYHPKEEPSLIEVRSERAQYWLGVGAQASEAVTAILKITGDWQKFKGEPGSEGTLKVAEPKRDKAEIFNEALKESSHEPQTEAVTRKSGKRTEPAAPAVAETPAAADVPAAAETPAEAEASAEALTPGVQTPEGATEQAEALDVKQTDADRTEERAGGEVPADKGGPGSNASGNTKA
jgi:small subunit ribosomal protein S16